MTDDKLLMLERKHGLRVTNSSVRGLHYLAADGDSRIAISGIQGVTLLTGKQVKALLDELKDIYEMQVERR